jgi:hypothetical protein
LTLAFPGLLTVIGLVPLIVGRLASPPRCVPLTHREPRYFGEQFFV